LQGGNNVRDEEDGEYEESMSELDESMRCVCGALAHEHEQIDLETIYTDAFLQLLQEDSAIEPHQPEVPPDTAGDKKL
jgi:hypothetical protein